MENKKTILCAILLLLLSLNVISFINPLDDEKSDNKMSLLDQINFLKSEGKLDFSISDEDNLMTIFLKEDESIDLGENHFENLKGKEGVKNSLKIDKSGNILEAHLFNSKPSTYLINGNEFEMPENGYLHYSPKEEESNKEGYFLPQFTKINKLSEASIINGINLSLPQGIFLSDGRASLSKEGYSVKGEGIYGGILFSSKNDVLIVKDNSFDASKYSGKYIQKTTNSIKVQSNSDKTDAVSVRFLEGNGIINMGNEGLLKGKQRFLSAEIAGGDSIELKKVSAAGDVPELIHESKTGGYTEIINGKNIYRFENDNVIYKASESLKGNEMESVGLKVKSDILGDKILFMNYNNQYELYDPNSKELPVLNMNKINETCIRDEIFNYAAKQVGRAGFAWNGREWYFSALNTETKKYETMKNPTKIPVFDCVGLVVMSLKKAYPDSTLRDFHPDLRLVGDLEKRGWKSYIIEPSSVVGKAKTAEEVRNIPLGAIVYLMHDVGGFVDGTKGISYISYTNSKGKKTNLAVGHALIRSSGEKNFINAYPDFGLVNSEIEAANEKAGYYFILGKVISSNMVPEHDYLYVMVYDLC